MNHTESNRNIELENTGSIFNTNDISLFPDVINNIELDSNQKQRLFNNKYLYQEENGISTILALDNQGKLEMTTNYFDTEGGSINLVTSKKQININECSFKESKAPLIIERLKALQEINLSNNNITEKPIYDFKKASERILSQNQSYDIQLTNNSIKL